MRFRACVGDGIVGTDELAAWVRGHTTVEIEAVLDVIQRGLALQPSADDDPWSAARLRRELCSRLVHLDLTIDDVLEAWDRQQSGVRGGDGCLTRREFLGHLKRLVTTGEYDWYTKVRGAACEIFDEFDADHQHVLSNIDLGRALLCQNHSLASREYRHRADNAAAGLMWCATARSKLENNFVTKELVTRLPSSLRLSQPRRADQPSLARHRVKILSHKDLGSPSQLPPLSPTSHVLSPIGMFMSRRVTSGSVMLLASSKSEPTLNQRRRLSESPGHTTAFNGSVSLTGNPLEAQYRARRL